MLGAVVHVEDHGHLWIKARDAKRREVWFGIEYQAVCSVGHRAVNEEERFHAPVRVGPCMAQLGPTFVGVLNFKANGNATRRSSS